MKSWLRECRWEIRALTVHNPPIVLSPRSLLFVCKGNICRSPFAALAATRWLEQAGIGDVLITSAGFRVREEGKPPYEAIAASHRFGLPLEGHRPRQLTDALVAAADAVVLMEAAHLGLRRVYSAHARRFYLLPLFTTGLSALERLAIVDPYGKPPAAFDACYLRICSALEVMMSQMFSDFGPPAGRGPEIALRHQSLV